MLYWASWYQPTDDFRPLTDPPNERILGWWCSGTRDDGAATLCSLVEAPDEPAAKAAVLVDWPEAREWRFVDPRDDKWRPSDRFVVSGGSWMEARLRAR